MRAASGIAGLAGLALLAAAFRFWALDRIPPGFHYDEAFEALEAWRVLNQPGYYPIFFAGNFGVEPAFIYLTAAAFRLFGETPAIMRGVAAAAGSLTVLAVYGLGRELREADPRIPAAMPLLSGAALAIMPWHVIYSRVGIEPVLVPLLLVVMLWAYYRGLRTNGRAAWACLGIAAGLGPYTYPAGRLLLFLLVALAGYTWLAGRPRPAGRLRGFLIAAAAAIVVVAPLAWHFARQPDLLLLRSSQIAVRAGGETAARGGLAENLLGVLGMFSVRGDADPRNNLPGLPVLDPAMSVAFYLGLGYALWRWRRPALGGLLLALPVMLAPTIFSEYAPHFRRAVGAVPVVAMLSGLGLSLILGRVGQLGKLPYIRTAGESGKLPPVVVGQSARLPRLPLGNLANCPTSAAARVVAVAAILLISGVLAANAYFVRWGRSADLYYAYDQGLWEIGQYLAARPAGEALYLSPRPAGDTTLAFALRDGPEVRRFDGRHAFVAPAFAAAPRGATYVIVEHEDFRGSRLLRELYPQAVEDRVFRDRDGGVYARAFYIPPAPAGQGLSPARRPQEPAGGEVGAIAAWSGAELIGFDVKQGAFRPGEVIYLQLWWRATAPIRTDWTVFTHLLGPEHKAADGRPTVFWAGQDAQPGAGSAAMPGWQPGDLVLDEYQITVPADAPAGTYTLEAGLYDLSADAARSAALLPAGADRVVLGEVEVK